MVLAVPANTVGIPASQAADQPTAGSAPSNGRKSRAAAPLHRTRSAGMGRGQQEPLLGDIMVVERSWGRNARAEADSAARFSIFPSTKPGT